MHLTFDHHYILAQSGIEFPYAAHGLYDLCQWRDRHIDFCSRIKTEIALLGLSAVALVETVVRLPIAMIAALFSKRNWKKGFHYSVLTVAHGFYGLFINLFSKKLSVPIIHFDLNLGIPFSNQLLFLACQSGREDLVRKLLARGSDPHQILSSSISAALVSRLVGHPHLNSLFVLNEFEKKFLKLKKLSHWLSLHGTVNIGDESIMLEGIPSNWMFDVLSKNFAQFFKDIGNTLHLSKEKCQQLKQALDFAYLEHSYEKIADRIQNHNLTFLGSGWKKHGICLCFFGDYMAIGNPGERPNDVPTLDVYKINSSLVTSTLVEEILMHETLLPNVGEIYFYQTLIQKLKGEKDSLSSSFNHIAPTTQEVGVCALSSKKAALRFAWAMLLCPLPDSSILKRAQFESKLFTDWAAVETYQKNLPFSNTIHENAKATADKKRRRFWQNMGWIF